MSNKEIAKQIIDSLPEYKVEKILFFLKGIQFDDEMEDGTEIYFQITETRKRTCP